jgi:hypothetical protein
LLQPSPQHQPCAALQGSKHCGLVPVWHGAPSLKWIEKKKLMNALPSSDVARLCSSSTVAQCTGKQAIWKPESQCFSVVNLVSQVPRNRRVLRSVAAGKWDAARFCDDYGKQGFESMYWVSVAAGQQVRVCSVCSMKKKSTSSPCAGYKCHTSQQISCNLK